MHSHITVPKSLTTTETINAYTDSGAQRKGNFHRDGKKFLKAVGAALGIEADLRSNIGGMAVSGEVTLHGDSIYLQMSEHFGSKGLSILFRTCNGRKDYCGHQNNTIMVKTLTSHDVQAAWISRLSAMIERQKTIAA